MTRSDPAKLVFALTVPSCDMSVAAKFDLPATLLAGEIGSRLSLVEDGTPVDPRAQAARMMGCLVLTDAGREMAKSLVAAWHVCTGRDMPLLDLSAVALANQEEEALRGLMHLCGSRLTVLAQHNADLLKMLAVLREAHEEQGAALCRTKSFLLRTVESRRWLAQAHGPLSLEAERQFCLAPGERLIQRLAAGSAGLSDIGIFLPDQDWPETGKLRARLHLVESDTLAGSWNLPGAELGPGWLRLTLLDALTDDEQTLRLELNWDGPAPLVLGAGVYHPDPTFGADLAGRRQYRILAHRIWKYLPGARAPLPADGHWAAVPGSAPVYIDSEHLSRAVPVDPDNPCLQYFPKLEALQVHPRRQKLSAARLMGAVAPGMCEVSATVGGRDERVPEVEYALAVAPRHPLREIGDLVDDCARRGYLSDWMRLSGDRQGDLCLILPEPIEWPCDLFLVTRPAPGAPHAYGWATFRNIRMTSGGA